MSRGHNSGSVGTGAGGAVAPSGRSRRGWVVAGLGAGVMLLGLGAGPAGVGPGGRRLSAPARRLLAGAGRDGTVYRTDLLAVHGADPDLRRRVAREAEFILAATVPFFGPVPEGRRPHIFVVADPAAWRALLDRAGARADALGMQWGDEVFVLRESGCPAALERLPHELVHWRFRLRYGRDAPFWLEEGTAGWLGWRLARASVRAMDGRDLAVERPPLDPGALRSWDDLTRLDGYPAAPEAARAVDRQVFGMVEALAGHLGDRGLAAYLDAVARDGLDWRAALAGAIGAAVADPDELEGRARRRATGAEGP